MIEIARYQQLLNYSRKFCTRREGAMKVDYRDLAHDVLLSGELDASSMYSLFNKHLHLGRTEEISMESVPNYTRQRKEIEYKYCYHCDQLFPLEYFMSGKTIYNDCWKYRTVKQSVNREDLKDSYLNYVIKKSGKGEDKEVVKKRIIAKRERIKQNGGRQTDKEWEAYNRNNLTDYYVRKLLVAGKVPKNQITPEKLEEKRQSILDLRRKKLQKAA